MSAPKKGKDLSALKARLAKKAAQASGGDEPAAAPAETSASPSQDAPAAAEAAPEPTPEPEAAAPVAEEAAAPAAEPEPEAAPAAAEPTPAPVEESPVAAAPAQSTGGAPFGGGAAFDPNDGLINDGLGDVAPKKSGGLLAVVAAAALAVGGLGGYLAGTASGKSKLIESGKKKGRDMAGEVQRLDETRKRIALQLKDASSALAKDPKKGAEALTKVLTDNVSSKYPKVEKLFGWQLAALDGAAIKRVFALYKDANDLTLDMGTLAAFVNQNAKVLTEGANGPSTFAIMTNKKGAVMVEVVRLLCDLEKKTPCGKGEASKAQGYEIRETLGGPTAVVGSDKAQLLLPDGPIYRYAIGETPQNNARQEFGRLFRKVNKRLEKMNKDGKKALEAVQQFTDNPNIDDNAAPAAAE